MHSAASVVGRRSAAVTPEFCVTLLLMLALLVPLVVVPGTFFPYVVPRNVLFRVVVEIALAIRVVEACVTRKRFDWRNEHVLLGLTGFLIAITLSSIFSPARAHSFYGDFERMGGVWAWLHLAGFFLLLRTVGEKEFTWLLHTALAAGVAASLHWLVESFSGDTDLTVIGNAGLFAGYVMLSLAIALYLATRGAKYRWLYLLGAGIELYALLVAENRSSVLGLVVGGVAAAVLLALGAERGQRRWMPLRTAAGVVAGLLVLIAIVKAVGASRLPFRVPAVVSRIAATDFGGLDALRSFQWEAALAGFRERPLFGFGIENHHLVWSAHFDPRSEQIGVDVFDRAHNQYLEVLATTGLVGTVGFLAIWAAIGYSLYRAFAARRLTVAQTAILAAANVAYAIYLIFWFVDINAAIIWLLLAALVSARSNAASIMRESERPVSRPLALAVGLVTVLTLAFVLDRHAYAPLRASIALATLDSNSGDAPDVLGAVQTIATSPARQTSHFGPVLSGFVRASRGDFTSSVAGGELDRAFEAAISAFDAELRRDPLNDRLHTAAAQLLLEAASYYDSPAYRERAITLLERAVELNPRRSDQRRLLGKVRSDSLVLRERVGN